MQGYCASQNISETSKDYRALIPKKLPSFPLQILPLNFLYIMLYSHSKEICLIWPNSERKPPSLQLSGKLKRL